MKTFRDIKLLYMRCIRQTLRNPIWIFISLFQPLLYLFLFMPLLKNLGDVPGLPLGKTTEVFIPGLLVMLSLFVSYAGFGLIDEIRSGFLERLLVTPVKRSAILWGPILRDATILFAQCSLIVIIAIPFGMTIDLSGLLLSFLLFLFIAIAMASMSYGFALIYKTEDTLASTINIISVPVLLLSGIFLPLILAPLWLQNLSKANPFLYVVNASRALFTGNLQSLDVLLGFSVISLLAILLFLWSLKALKKMVS